MRPIWILIACLAISLAEENTLEKEKETDSKAEESAEVLRTGEDNLHPAASTYQNNYIPPSQRPPKQWNNYAPQNNYSPPTNSYVPPANNYIPPTDNYIPPTNNYVPPVNNYVPPVNNAPPQNDYYNPPQNNYIPPQNNYIPPQNNYIPPQNNYIPPQNNYIPPQNDWNQQWNPPQTTPSTVIKNDQTIDGNGNYKYEYQISDGTHVNEEGYVKNPNTEAESVVKKGFYSYTGADGVIYKVTYWADETGFHASGDHLPTPPPIPPALQAAIDQANKAEAEKNKHQQQTSTPSYNQQWQQPSTPVNNQQWQQPSTPVNNQQWQQPSTPVNNQQWQQPSTVNNQQWQQPSTPVNNQQQWQQPQQTWYPNQQQTYYPQQSG